jgi:hypothetical protein
VLRADLVIAADVEIAVDRGSPPLDTVAHSRFGTAIVWYDACAVTTRGVGAGVVGSGGDGARAVFILIVAAGASAVAVVAAARSSTPARPLAFAVGAAIHRAATVVVIAEHITARPPRCVPVGALAPIVNIPAPTSPMGAASGFACCGERPAGEANEETEERGKVVKGSAPIPRAPR